MSNKRIKRAVSSKVETRMTIQHAGMLLTCAHFSDVDAAYSTLRKEHGTKRC